MNPDYLQISVLSLIQGLTEFLPISSSAHLQLPALLLAWPDRGIAFDIAVHLGTLFAVVFYFRRDLRQLIVASLAQLSGRDISDHYRHDARMTSFLLIASIPAGISGLLLYDLIAMYGRNAQLIAATSILFALLMWWVDRNGNQKLSMEDWNLRRAVFVGVAQALALIPGTSRSGVTMTAALQCGFSREAASRFSFLLAIPVIAGSGGLLLVELLNSNDSAVPWMQLVYAAGLACLIAILCIHYFLKMISGIGFLPFVIYRVGLGVLILVLL